MSAKASLINQHTNALTSVQPAVDDRGPRGVRLAEIAEHHCGTSDADLARHTRRHLLASRWIDDLNMAVMRR